MDKITVTQADRDAAKALSEYAGFAWSADHLDMAIDAAAEAFARHRLAALTDAQMAAPDGQLAELIRTRLLGVHPDNQDLQLEDSDWRVILASLSASNAMRDALDDGTATLLAVRDALIGDDWDNSRRHLHEICVESLARMNAALAGQGTTLDRQTVEREDGA